MGAGPRERYGELVADARFLRGRPVEPGVTRFVRADRKSAAGCPFPCRQLQHCGRFSDDCRACQLARQRVIAAHDDLLAHPEQRLEEVGRRHGVGRVVDRSQPSYPLLQRLMAEAVLAWRLACGENAVLLCWCWPKACHATATGRCATAAALWFAERPQSVPEAQRADGPTHGVALGVAAGPVPRARRAARGRAAGGRGRPPSGRAGLRLGVGGQRGRQRR